MKPFVLGLTGPGGAGKSTVARAIVAALPRVNWRPGAVVLHPGAPLKAMLRAFYEAAGLSPAAIERRVDGDLKRAPCALLCGRSPTHAQQTLGTDWGRHMIGESLWLDLWNAAAARHLGEHGQSVINDSVRFDNEAAAIRALGGVVVRLAGRRDPAMPAHVSEAGVRPDLTVENPEGAPERAARAILDALAARV